jgi:hypothetical protein
MSIGQLSTYSTKSIRVDMCLWHESSSTCIGHGLCLRKVSILSLLATVREGVRGRPAPGCDVGKVNANGRSHSRCGALLV